MSALASVVLGTEKKAKEKAKKAVAVLERPLAEVVRATGHGAETFAQRLETVIRPHEAVVEQTPAVSVQETPSVVVTPVARVVRRPRLAEMLQTEKKATRRPRLVVRPLAEVVPVPLTEQVVSRRPLLRPRVVRPRPLISEIESTENIAESSEYMFAPTLSRVLNRARSIRFAPSLARAFSRASTVTYAPEITEVYQPSVSQSRTSVVSRVYNPNNNYSEAFTASGSGNANPVLNYVLEYNPERNIPLLFLPPAYPSVQGENFSPETEITIEPRTAIVIAQNQRPVVKSDVFAKQFIAKLLELG